MSRCSLQCEHDHVHVIDNAAQTVERMLRRSFESECPFASVDLISDALSHQNIGRVCNRSKGRQSNVVSSGPVDSNSCISVAVQCKTFHPILLVVALDGCNFATF